jgi:hypothetical protein
LASGKAVARIGDHGTGICHLHSPALAFTTTFTTGSSVMTTDGIGVCVIGSTGLATCGHHTRATTGSGLCGATDGSFHRVGDTGVISEDASGNSTYTVTTGSPTMDSL